MQRTVARTLRVSSGLLRRHSLNLARCESSKNTQDPIKRIENRELAEDKKITHTGQHWEADDYRMARFEMIAPKQYNERFAINLVNEAPPKPVNQPTTFCDGGGGPLGHPRVYINLEKPGNHICGYCGLRFYYAQESGQLPYPNDVPGV